MNATIMRALACGTLVVLTLVLGYVLGRKGRPYGTAILSIHKIASLVAGIAFAVIVIQSNAVKSLDPFRWTVIALSAMLFVATFATGAVLTIQKESGKTVLLVHKIGPVLTTLSFAISFFLLA